MVAVKSLSSRGHVDLDVLIGLGIRPNGHVASGVASDGAPAAPAVGAVRGVVCAAAAVSVARRNDRSFLPAATASSLVTALDAANHVSGLDHTEVRCTLVAVAARPQHERRHIKISHVCFVARHAAQIREAAAAAILVRAVGLDRVLSHIVIRARRRECITAQRKALESLVERDAFQIPDVGVRLDVDAIHILQRGRSGLNLSSCRHFYSQRDKGIDRSVSHRVKSEKSSSCSEAGLVSWSLVQLDMTSGKAPLHFKQAAYHSGYPQLTPTHLLLRTSH